MDNRKPVLVVGATGLLGTEVCRQLLAADKNVRAMVRSSSDPSKVKALKEMGVETMVADLKDPGSLAPLLDGINAVISTASSTLSQTEGDSIESVDRIGQLNLVTAADQAWVEKFIFVSFKPTPISFPLQDAKREVENALIESNMTYTILRAEYFMEVWLGPHLGFDVQNHKATIYGHGANKMSWVSLRDVASFAVASLDNTAAINSIIDVGGPQAVSPLEVVKVFEEHTGQSFEIQYMSEEALTTQKEVSTAPMQQSFYGLMLNLARGSVTPMDEILASFPIRLTSVLDYCHEVLGQKDTVEA
jgi:uncharacterized protein YbjT (DUF2867 family)